MTDYGYLVVKSCYRMAIWKKKEIFVYVGSLTDKNKILRRVSEPMSGFGGDLRSLNASSFDNGIKETCMVSVDPVSWYWTIMFMDSVSNLLTLKSFPKHWETSYIMAGLLFRLVLWNKVSFFKVFDYKMLRLQRPDLYSNWFGKLNNTLKKNVIY